MSGNRDSQFSDINQAKNVSSSCLLYPWNTNTPYTIMQRYLLCVENLGHAGKKKKINLHLQLQTNCKVPLTGLLMTFLIRLKLY